MFLLSVIPFTKGGTVEELSYFSLEEAAEGDIVQVPIRSRKVPALVVRTAPVADAKSEIRRAGYSLKKIQGTPRRGIVDAAFVRATRRIADWSAVAPSAVFAAALPKALFEGEAAPHEVVPEHEVSAAPRLAAEKLVFQGSREARLDQYRTLVRSEFARGGSVLLLAPTIAEAETLHSVLRRGIEAYVVVLHSQVAPKELKKRVSAALDPSHPVLVIATPAYLAFHRDDVRMIVVEREDATGWRSVARPFVDFRMFAEYLAEERGLRLLLSGEPLRIATMARLENGSLEAFATPTRRASAEAGLRIIDTRKTPASTTKKQYSVFSDRLLMEIDQAVAEQRKIILFATRRGLAPITVCGDCGVPVLCQFSETPMALHKTSKGTVFVCRACGETRSAKEMCRACGSWKLVPLGVGVERVEEEIESRYPLLPLFVLERERAKTHHGATKIAQGFFSTKGPALLLGTEMMLPYLADQADVAAVVSMDSLLSMPEWNAYERTYSVLVRLAEAAREGVFIQTRMPDAPILDIAQKGDLASFYKMEIESRRTLGYPPFSVFIKVSVEGSQVAVDKEMKEIEALLSPAPLRGAGRPLHLGANRYRHSGFLRLPRELWPDPELLAKLRSLPPSVTIIIDPDSVL